MHRFYLESEIRECSYCSSSDWYMITTDITRVNEFRIV